MEIAYLHLVTNHIPIIGVPLALLLLLWGVWRKSDELKTASLILLALLSIATIGVYLLGKGGEDFVEELRGVSHDTIDAHEDFALFALVPVLILGAMSAFALLRFRFRTTGAAKSGEMFPRWIVFLIIALSVGSSAVLGYTGRLGGKIRHPEFHASETSTQSPQDADAENDGDEADEGDGGGRRRGRNRGGR